MTSSLDMIRGRSNVVTLTNSSGGALVAGDVCILNTGADESATTTTSANSVSKVYIAAESIASGATGKFYSAGFCPLVTPSASVTRGRYLFTHTVAKQAAENATYGAGAFGVILKSGTTPSVWLFGSTAQGSGGGVARSGSTTDNHLVVWNGSDADSIKDGGAAPASANGLIGLTAYNPGATDTVISATSMTDVDATNFKVTFTAPASGNVLIRLTCSCYISSTSAVLNWGLREATSNIAGPVIAKAGNGSDGGWTPASVLLYLTGVGAGAHTYKWSADRETGNCNMRYGAQYGLAVMEVWAAP